MGPKKAAFAEPDVTIPDGDAAAGRAVFDANCSACHALEGDAKAASAPMLGGLFGRKVGSTAFAYSKAAKGAGFTWTPKHFWVFIQNPSKYIPGNRMAFAGISSDKDRADLIAYLSEN